MSRPPSPHRGQLLAWGPSTCCRTSNTMLIAEKYSKCYLGGLVGGSYWAYSALSRPVLPAPMNPPRPVYPGFEITFFAGVAPQSIGPASKFQVQPSPFVGNCDPF